MPHLRRSGNRAFAYRRRVSATGPPRPPETAIWAARLTWAAIVVTFIALLGGTHPSDARRDAALAIAAAVVALLNAPVAWWIVRRLRGPPRRGALVALGGLALRVAASAWVLSFVGSISHERPDPDADEAHDAWRACRRQLGGGAALTCEALHRCADEATLTAAEQERLLARIRALPGCEDP